MKQNLEKTYNDKLFPWLVSLSGDFYPLRYNNDSKKVVYGREDWLFYGAEKSLEYYQATNILSEEEMEKRIQTIRELQAVCESRGVKLRIMFAPNKEQIYYEYMPTLKIEDGNKRIDQLVDYIKTNSNIKVVYPKQALLKAKAEEQVYYKYDTHWSPAGAYVGVQALYNSLGIELQNWKDIEKTQRAFNVGDLLGMGDIDQSRYTNDRTYTIKYKPSVTVNVSYGTKIGAEVYSNTLHSTSSSPRKEKIVLIGDSFRENMVTYLQKDFSEATITHRNYLIAEDVQKAVLDADVLVLCAVERYDDLLFSDAEKILKLYQELN